MGCGGDGGVGGPGGGVMMRLMGGDGGGWAGYGYGVKKKDHRAKLK